MADGVHRIPSVVPNGGLKAINVYAIETESGLVLIDGGWALREARSQLEKSLRSIGFRMTDITRFLVTHFHRDHYTQAVAVRREFGPQVFLGIGERASLEIVRRGGEQVSDVTQAQLRSAGAPHLAESWIRLHIDEQNDTENWEAPDEWIDAEQTIRCGTRDIEAIETPGHTQGHLVFADRAAGLLFSGDHVLSSITPSIGLEAVDSPQALSDFLSSLRKILALPDLLLLPAHGPVRESSHARVNELLAHHDRRLQLCLAAVKPGSTAYDVAHSLPWTRRETPFAELDEFNSALATLETRVHLEHLVTEGKLTADTSGGVTMYSTPATQPDIP